MAPGWEEFCLDPKFVSPAQTRAGFVLSSERERMERPHHLQTGNTSNSSKLMGIVIVAGIHVLAIIALVTALASGQIMKQIRDIQGFGSRRESAAQGAAAAAAGSGEAAAAGRHRSGIQRAAGSAAADSDQGGPAAGAAQGRRSAGRADRTQADPAHAYDAALSHHLPASGRAGHVAAAGRDHRPKATSRNARSSSPPARSASTPPPATYVQGHWRWQPPTQEGKPVAVSTDVSVVWNLKDAQ